MFTTNEIEAPEVGGKRLECMHCKSKRFKHYEVRLQITPRSMFHVPPLGLIGTAYVCRACGYNHTFFPPS